MGSPARARTLLMVNRNKASAQHASARVTDAIEDAAHLVASVDAIEPGKLPGPGTVDVAIVLGGDGTILTAAKHALALGCPILGVNTGKVGFMAGYELERFLEDAPGLLSDLGAARRRRVRVMRASLSGDDGTERYASIALNDFVITAGPPYRMIHIDIRIDGHPGPTISGDGAIVSSPIGSTAYSVSSGGPIVAPGVDAWVVVPIAAHSLSFRPIVVASDSTVSLTLASANRDNDHGTCLLVDGQPGPRLAEGDRIEIRDDGRRAEFILDPKTDYWSTLIKKMRWAQAPDARGIS